MSSLATAFRAFLIVAVTTVSFAACASGSYDSVNTLGVMPLRPPTPVWLGSVHGNGSAASTIAGAAAVTPSQIPGWAHVLISLDDVSSGGGVYGWTLHSGSCASPGGVIGPADRYGDFIIRADGSGAAEAVVPLTPSPSDSYSVVATPVSPNTGTTACADLTRESL